MDSDTCNPNLKKVLHTHNFYGIILPILLMTLVLEVVFVFMFIPTSIGNALTAAGPFPTSKVPLIK